jgi:hypothetical protein
MQRVEDAAHDASEVWNFQLGAIRDYGASLHGKKAMDEKALRGELARLSAMEARAAAAFGVVAMSQKLSMGLDTDFTTRRLEAERAIATRMTSEYERILEPLEEELLDRIERIGGLPLMVADAEEDGYEPQNPALDALHAFAANANRLNPVRMAERARDDLASRKVALQGRVFAGDAVSREKDAYDQDMADIEFAFNEADALLIGDGQVRAISTHPRAAREEEKGREDRTIGRRGA